MGLDQIGLTSLDRAGYVLGVSPQHVILRAGERLSDPELSLRDLPRLGATIVDASFQPVGTLHDLFGPTCKPFLSVKLARDAGLALDSFRERVGEMLYVRDSRRHARRRHPSRGRGKSRGSAKRDSRRHASSSRPHRGTTRSHKSH